MPYKTIIRIWSRHGHTPLTKRAGGYCDELANVTIECANPEEAAKAALELKKQTPFAYACHYSMPDYPNQNTRAGFCHYG